MNSEDNYELVCEIEREEFIRDINQIRYPVFNYQDSNL
jgi:hypothetical protein